MDLTRTTSTLAQASSPSITDHTARTPSPNPSCNPPPTRNSPWTNSNCSRTTKSSSQVSEPRTLSPKARFKRIQAYRPSTREPSQYWNPTPSNHSMTHPLHSLTSTRWTMSINMILTSFSSPQTLTLSMQTVQTTRLWTSKSSNTLPRSSSIWISNIKYSSHRTWCKRVLLNIFTRQTSRMEAV